MDEDQFVVACMHGDENTVETYLRTVSRELPFYAMMEACAKGHENIVRLLWEDSRIVWSARKNAKYYGDPQATRDLLPVIFLDESRAYVHVDSDTLPKLFSLLVQHSKTAPESAFHGVRKAQTLRTLLDKAHVALSINVICTYIVNKRVDLLRVLADTPWLGFSRRTLVHLESLAEKHSVPHVFPAPEWRSVWDDEENNHSCWGLHTTTTFRHLKSNPTVLAVVWIMHQVKMGWADIAEPVIERLHPVVVLELDNEGPFLGIPGAPVKPAFWGVRLMLFVAGIAFVSIAWGLFFIAHDKFNPIASMLFFCAGCAMVATVYFGPSQPRKKQN